MSRQRQEEMLLAELRTAFATLSMTGKLVSFEWPRPGLKLNYLNK